MLAIGGTAVIVGLPPTGAMAAFEPRALAESEQRVIGPTTAAAPAIDFRTSSSSPPPGA
jgi:S-(hydroxymethyl)glutathione dehydrogenase/alcohol dehydrogenase